MAELEKWLLTTIPGVLILSAIGSIIAIGILKLASVAITSWFPLTKRWLLFRKDLELGPHGRLLGALSADDNIPVLLAYFAFRIMRFIGWLFVSGLSFIVYFVLASANDGQPPALGSIAFLFFGFGSFYLAGQEVRIVRIVYDQEVVPQIKSFRESLKLGATTAPGNIGKGG